MPVLVRNIRVNYHISELDTEAQMQFSATSFILNDESCYIAFRGTDGTIVGWKEDFNMAFTSSSFAERQHCYISTRFRILPGTSSLFVGGHSKGGNLAVYAAMNTENRTRERIAPFLIMTDPVFQKKLYGVTFT